MWIPTNGCLVAVKEKFAALSRFQQIFCFVFGLHLFVVFALGAHHFWGREKPKTKMVVRTLRPPMVRSQVVAAAPPQIKREKKQASSPLSKQPSQVVKKSAPPSKPKAALNTSLIEQMEKQMAILEEKSVFPKAPSLTLPSACPEIEEKEIPLNYGEKIVAYLQNALELPELGEVKVDLELDFSGRIVRVDVIEAKSKKNGEFLKKRLPELALPCFNEGRKSDATVVFTITFKNLDSPSFSSF